jgi:hypothetical protein
MAVAFRVLVKSVDLRGNEKKDVDAVGDDLLTTFPPPCVLVFSAHVILPYKGPWLSTWIAALELESLLDHLSRLNRFDRPCNPSPGSSRTRRTGSTIS